MAKRFNHNRCAALNYIESKRQVEILTVMDTEELERSLIGHDRRADAIKEMAQHVRPMIEDARVFCVRDDLFVDVHSAAGDEIDAEFDADHWNDTPERERAVQLRDAAMHRSFPHDLPFDNVFLSVTPSVGLQGHRMAVRFEESQYLRPEYKDKTMGHLLGYLVNYQGTVIEFIVIPHLNDSLVLCSHRLAGFKLEEKSLEYGRWSLPETGTPWAIPALISLINAHVSLGTSYEKQSKAYRRVFKKIGCVPAPYYPIHLKQETYMTTVRDSVKTPISRAPLSFRFDRRGCFVLRKCRGDLPIKPKLKERLLLKGYKVWEGISPNDQETLDMMALRNVANPTQTQWLATSVHWRESTIVGAESLPYREAVRHF